MPRPAPAARLFAVIGSAGIAVALFGAAWLVKEQRQPSAPVATEAVPKKIIPRAPLVATGPRDVFHETVAASLVGLAKEVDLAQTVETPTRRSGDKSKLRDELLIATASGTPELIAELISKVTQTPEGIGYMEEFLKDETLPLYARKHAAEALMRVGTQDAVEAVLGACLGEFESGQPEAGSAILAAVQIPVGIEGAKGLVSVLLGQNGSGEAGYSLPVEMQSVLRKTLRAESNPEEIGRYLADLYLEMQSSGQTANTEELLNGVAHPAMLAELAAQAQMAGNSEEATGLFDRLIAATDSGVVGAVARLASAGPSLLNNASDVLFNWSRQHPREAQVGLFTEYLDNRMLPMEQRVAAAYGLAGLAGKAEARQVLEKSIAFEPDPATRQCLQKALASLLGIP